MRAQLHRKYKFSASHRLHCEGYTPQQNREVYGKCNNPHGHGHNYVLEVTVSGEVDAVTGMVIDLGELDSLVQQRVVSRFNVSNLNKDTEFAASVPTTENLSMVAYNLLRPVLPPGTLERVTIEETSNNSFAYGGD